MFQLTEARTADEVWVAIAHDLSMRHSTSESVQPSRVGDTVEILHSAISIAEPKQRWVLSRTPAINPAFALAEVVWILSGRNDSAFLTFFNRQLSEFAGEGPTFHGAYGFRLRKSLEFDQLERAYHVLRENSHSRQVVLQIWDGNLDMPAIDGAPRSDDIPCNVMSMLKVRDGRLEWMQILRSNDVFLGLPYNIVQFTSLQEIMAGWLGLGLGSYNQISDSLHAYTNSILSLGNIDPIPVDPNTDSLACSFEVSREIFADLAARIDQMIAPGLTPDALRSLSDWSGPSAYGNILLILSAETSRRRAWPGLTEEFIQRCSNPVFRQLWRRWYSRWAGDRSESA